jgi:hypothetical protein
MARGHAPGGRYGGGRRIQAPRIHRPRLKLRKPRPRWARLLRAGGALACAGALVVYPALETPKLTWLLWIVAALALLTLVVGLGWRHPPLFLWALALIGVQYASWLEIGTHALDQRAPVVGAGLLLTAELAFDSLEPELGPSTSTAALARLIVIAAVLLVSVGVDAIVLGATSIPVGGGIALTAVGVTAAVMALGLVFKLASSHR